jgi:putative sterol carrier protein
MAAHFLKQRWSDQSRQNLIRESANQEVQHSEQETITTIFTDLVRKLDGRHPGLTQTVKIKLIDGNSYRLVFENGSCTFTQEEGPATATIEMTQTDAIGLLSGELDPMVAFSTGKIQIEGEIQALLILQDLV